ncbi:hypothetical protein [Haloparvum sedimenti]|uniref:hypothetical protein n=1 Tax=Haloparvum sedimenti TaxID=1678448 RepID=UPI00071E89FF|nr:hypothetical protein [Haloparvum sedimenti]
MTDASDTPVGGEPGDGGSADGPNLEGDDAEARPTEPVEREELSLDDLTLPQRVFVAAVQNPTRGVFVAFLLAFAFSFYIALWLAFPRFAALGSAATAVAAVAIGGVLYLLR